MKRLYEKIMEEINGTHASVNGSIEFKESNDTIIFKSSFLPEFEFIITQYYDEYDLSIYFMKNNCISTIGFFRVELSINGDSNNTLIGINLIDVSGECVAFVSFKNGSDES